MDIARYVGIPYRPGGRALDGVDCYGLIWVFYHEELKIDLPLYAGDPDFAELKELSRIIHEREVYQPEWVEVAREDARLGDVVDLSIMGGFHVGIFVPPHKMLHAMLKTASCIDDVDRPKWKRRIRGLYRRARS